MTVAPLRLRSLDKMYTWLACLCLRGCIGACVCIRRIGVYVALCECIRGVPVCEYVDCDECLRVVRVCEYVD